MVRDVKSTRDLADRARERALEARVLGLSPAELLILSYEQVLANIERADEAFSAAQADTAAGAASRQNVRAHGHILRAQRLIHDLHANLDPTHFEGAANLGRIYERCFTLLALADVERSAADLASVRDILTPLLEAWREAVASTRPDVPPAAAQ